MSSKASFKQTTMNDTLQGEKNLYCGESKDSCAPFIRLFKCGIESGMLF